VIIIEIFLKNKKCICCALLVEMNTIFSFVYFV
jgi:hypothetical protein